eukprot:1147829-Pelagomonas_calceolata.AAC.1
MFAEEISTKARRGTHETVEQEQHIQTKPVWRTQLTAACRAQTRVKQAIAGTGAEIIKMTWSKLCRSR